MGNFISINYTRLTCQDCKEVTLIEPGRRFSKLNCSCNAEASKQCSNIELFITQDGAEVELLGEFDNGDKEVKATGGTLSYRIPKATFENFTKKADNETVKMEKNLLQLDREELNAIAKEHGIRRYKVMDEDTLRSKLGAIYGAS